MTWVPSISLFVKFLIKNGANKESLFPLQYDNLKIPVEIFHKNGVVKQEPGGDDTQADLSFPVLNFSKLVNFYTHCLQNNPTAYTQQELKQLMVILCRCSLDLRLQIVLFDIETCIAAVLECFGSDQWPDEVHVNCVIFSHVMKCYTVVS